MKQSFYRKTGSVRSTGLLLAKIFFVLRFFGNHSKLWLADHFVIAIAIQDSGQLALILHGFHSLGNILVVFEVGFVTPFVIVITRDDLIFKNLFDLVLILLQIIPFGLVHFCLQRIVL